MRMTVPPVHQRPDQIQDYKRLDILWDRYPQYHEKTVFSSLDRLLEEHETYGANFEELRDEYLTNDYDRFLIRLVFSVERKPWQKGRNWTA